jgi:hypothetical protein
MTLLSALEVDLLWVRDQSAVDTCQAFCRAGETSSPDVGDADSAACPHHGRMDAGRYGVLAEVGTLGPDLLEARQLTRDCKSPGSGDNRSP